MKKLKHFILIFTISLLFNSLVWAENEIPPNNYKDPQQEFMYVQKVVDETKTPWAAYKLGYYYENGLGTKADLNQAYFWYRLSAVNKFKPGEVALEKLKKKLTNSQLNEVEKTFKEKRNQMIMDDIKKIRNYNMQ